MCFIVFSIAIYIREYKTKNDCSKVTIKIHPLKFENEVAKITFHDKINIKFISKDHFRETSLITAQGGLPTNRGGPQNNRPVG